MASKEARQEAINKAAATVRSDKSGFVSRAKPAKRVRWVTVDPGEDCGLSIWEDNRLIYGCTLKMGVVGPLFHALLVGVDGEVEEFLRDYPEAEDFMQQVVGYDIERVVCEDWKLYPWVMYTDTGRATHALDFDQCRTARLIGKIELCCLLSETSLYLQGADIKETAVAAGAENLYYKPLHENRHQNDAIQHGVFYTVIEEQKPPVDARV